MAATLNTSPPALALAHDPVWVKLQTSLISENFAQFKFAISAANNNQNEIITLSWGSNTLIFTLKNSPDNSGLQLPVYSGGDLDAYAASLAERFRQNEILHTDFNVFQYASLGGLKYIELNARTSGVLDLTGSDTVSNITTTVTDGVADASEDNLRAVLEVWSEATEDHLDELLLKQHAPYDIATAKALFDISPAFVHLTPHLPSESTIPNLIDPEPWTRGTCSSNLQTYYLRYADKYGIPAVAEALQKSSLFRVIHGSKSPGAVNDYHTQQLRHAYNRQDGTTFYKPVSLYQPDWVYWWSGAANAGTFQYSVELTWSDGTIQETLSGDNFIISPNTLYWFTAGPPHFQLESATPPSAGAEIVKYRFSLVDINSDTYWFNVYYKIIPDCNDWGLILLFDNGVGGCETVYLHGKTNRGYEFSGQEIYRRLRTPDFDLQDGEFFSQGTTGQKAFTASTGWHDEAFYIEHLQQMPLGKAAWIVDTQNQRFLKVIIEARSIETVRQDDQDMYSLSFTFRAAWSEKSHNV